MKKYFLLLLVPFVIACGREAEKKAQELQARNDSLMSQTLQKDEAINEFIASINEIQGTLDTIKMKENIITLSTDKGGELKVSAKEQIKSDITTIYSLMMKNKETLNALQKKLRNTNLKVDELNKMVERLQKDITAKTAEIEALRDKLAKMNIEIDEANLQISNLSETVKTQTGQIENQTQTIQQQEEALNTAYYIIGTSKDLKKNGIIKNDKILPDFNKDLFTKINIQKTTEISILSKGAKVLSNHPSSSFKLIGDKKTVQSLQILDNKAFWANSKFLVIVID
jgi:chromosome segregation ATPase